MQAAQNPKAADAVADEVDGVFGIDHAFFQLGAEEIGEVLYRFGLCVFSRHQFH